MRVIKNEFQFKKYKKAMATVETLKNRSCPEQAVAGVDIPDSTQLFRQDTDLLFKMCLHFDP